MKSKYRIKKVAIPYSFCDDEKEYVIEWCVQVHWFAWFWVTVKVYKSDIFERDGKLEDYGEWMAQELLDKLEEEED